MGISADEPPSDDVEVCTALTVWGRGTGRDDRDDGGATLQRQPCRGNRPWSRYFPRCRVGMRDIVLNSIEYEAEVENRRSGVCPWSG